MNDHTPREGRPLTRGSLVKLGGLAASAVAAAGWRARAGRAATVACVLTPEQTEGPYYIAGEQVRRNITEGKPGTALTLRLSVLDASTCKAIPGAAVDIWHCDGGGAYSGVGSASDKRTFLRGIQPTDAKGVATFQTIYPGWYRGRTVHIHVKVHVGGSVVHTGQLFFPDSLTDGVYARSPYRSRPGRDTRNADDSIYATGGKQSTLALRRSGAGYVGTIAMGVRATSPG